MWMMTWQALSVRPYGKDGMSSLDHVMAAPGYIGGAVQVDSIRPRVESAPGFRVLA